MRKRREREKRSERAFSPGCLQYLMKFPLMDSKRLKTKISGKMRPLKVDNTNAFSVHQVCFCSFSLITRIAKGRRIEERNRSSPC